MGMIFSSVLSQLFGKKEVQILILGLDNAGKTTILYKLYAPDKVTRTTPTVGFNIEQVSYKNLSFTMWDLGGQTNIRPFWRCYIGNTSAVIYVIDSADRERIGLAKKELYGILQEEEMAGAHLLVFANKQDQPNALSDMEVAKELGLAQIRDRKWFICKTNGITGTGLTTGLDWLADAILGNENATFQVLSGSETELPNDKAPQA